MQTHGRKQTGKSVTFTARPATRRLSCVAVAAVLAIWPPAVRAQDEAPQDEPPQLAIDAGGHTVGTNKLVFSKDGKTLYSASNDKTIRLWDVATGEALGTILAPQRIGDIGRLYCVSLHPDQNRLAFSGFTDEYTVYTYLLDQKIIEYLLRGHTDVVMDLAFSPGGKWLATGSADHLVKLWDVTAEYKWRYDLKGHTDSVYALAFAPSGLQLASVSYDGTAKIWQTESGKLLADIPASTGKLYAVAWSPDGKQLAVGGADMAVRIYTSQGKLLKTFEDLGNEIFTLTFTPDGSELVGGVGGSAGDTQGAGILNLASGAIRVVYEGNGDSVTACAVSPDGSVAATGDHSGPVELWSTRDGTRVRVLKSKGRPHPACAWHKDGQSIGWSNDFDADSNRPRYVFDFTDLDLLEVDAAALQPEDWLTGSTVLGDVEIEEVERGKVVVNRGGKATATFTLGRPHDQARSGAILPGERGLIGSDFGLYLFNLRSGEQLLEYQGHTGIVYDLAPAPDRQHFLSASEDQTLRIWNVNQELPLLSLFVAEDDFDWVIWTPEGYYACSPGRERLIGWHVNRGRNSTPAYYPAAQFRKSLYRPDVIKLVLSTGSTAAAVELADAQRGRQSQQVEVADVLPPVVTITLPAEARVTVNAPRLVVQAVAQAVGSAPVTAMQLLLNDRPYLDAEGRRAIEPGRAQEGRVRETWEVDLVPGVHRLVAKGETAASYGLSEPIEVVYKPELTELPALYVLAVGISEYADRDYQLNYAAIDARSVAETFQAKSKPLFRRIETRVVVDDQATRRGVLDGLTWLKQQMTHRDVGVFFYAGHGVKDIDGTFYLFPSDGEADSLDATAVAAEQVKRYCQSIPGRLLMLLDACHTGALGGDRRRSLGGLADDLVRDLVTDDYGVIVLASSMGRESSLEDDAWKHGAFTKAIVEALEGYADYNRDKTVYLNELELYVPERVKELTEGKQHPVSQKPTTVRSFPLAIP